MSDDTSRVLRQIREGEGYAQAMMRAIELTAAAGMHAEAEAMDQIVKYLSESGMEITLARWIDSDHMPAVMRWRVTVHTDRGRIPIELDSPRDWKDKLAEMGWL